MQRYPILDEIRGITLCSMIGYHAMWDLVYMFGADSHWYRGNLGYVWQQSICWCFILLSGFCFSLGRKKIKRGLTVFGAGTLVTIVTHLLMPEQKVRFGVLTMLGISMLLLAFFEKMVKTLFTEEKWKTGYAYTGILVSAGLFFFTREINNGYLGFEGLRILKLPDSFYSGGDFMTFLGFTGRSFWSTDYFSLMPWFFLFLTGYFFSRLAKEKEWLEKLYSLPSLGSAFRFMGKHSLIIYLLHQPVIYGVFFLLLS